MRYPIIELAEARRYLIAKRDGDGDVSEPAVVWAGTGEELGASAINALQGILNELMEKFGDNRSDQQNSDFESEASVHVHQLLALDAEVAVDHGFWRWLAISQFKDVVEWRYNRGGQPIDLKNYGLGAKSENLFFRLWLRAELSLDEDAEDPYHLARRGQVDFWRSHILRQDYASVPAMARALIQFQYPKELSGKPRLKIQEIRSLAPRMKRLRANLLYEVLDEESCTEILSSEAVKISQEANR